MDSLPDLPILAIMETDVTLDREDLEIKHEEKVRSCLVCSEDFVSAWAGERVCKRCRSSAAWRNG